MKTQSGENAEIRKAKQILEAEFAEKLQALEVQYGCQVNNLTANIGRVDFVGGSSASQIKVVIELFKSDEQGIIVLR
jgi:hypothetical protein